MTEAVDQPEQTEHQHTATFKKCAEVTFQKSCRLKHNNPDH